MKKGFLGVGHGGNDPGAVANGIRESDANLVVAMAAQEELIRHGITMGMSRVKDENDPLQEEIVEAKAFKPDFAVECHANAGGGDGFECYVPAKCARSKRLAECIEKRVKEIGQNSRGVKTRLYNGADYYGWNRDLYKAGIPNVLCEAAFLDNKTDVQIFNTIEKQRAFGVAYAKGVLDYLGIEWKPKSTTLYGVVQQKIALSDKKKAQAYTDELNKKQGSKDNYFKVIEIT